MGANYRIALRKSEWCVPRNILLRLLPEKGPKGRRGVGMIRNQRPPALQIRKAGSLFFLSFPGRAPNQRKSVEDESPNGAARDSFIYFLLGFSSPWSRIYSNTPAHNPATKSRPCIGTKSHYAAKNHNTDKQNDSYAPYYLHPPGTFLQAHPSYRIRKHGVHPSLISGGGGKRVLSVTFLHFILRF